MKAYLQIGNNELHYKLPEYQIMYNTKKSKEKDIEEITRNQKRPKTKKIEIFQHPKIKSQN